MDSRRIILVLFGFLVSGCEFPVNRIETTQRMSNWGEFQTLLSAEATDEINQRLGLYCGDMNTDGTTWCDILADPCLLSETEQARRDSEVAQFLHRHIAMQREEGQTPTCDEQCAEDYLEDRLKERSRVCALHLECAQAVESLRAAR